MNLLSVIRASAGSGKTHFLTGFYLKILMKEPVDYFKQMLAVTFTNKATGEMKRRIIDELYKLSKGEHSNHLSLLISFTGKPEKSIREKSAKLLENILHDYSWFSVETIDSFFQRIIRGFTHEIGVPGNYTIEIETQPVLQYAVDTLIDGVGDKSDLLTWLVHYTEDKIQQGKTWDVRHGLMNLGHEIFKEKFTENATSLIDAIADKQKLTRFRDELMRAKFVFESRIIEIGKKGIEIINSHGFTDDDFYQKSNGAKKFFDRFSSLELINSAGVLHTQTTTYQKLLESADNWPSSTTKRKEEIIANAVEHLLPLLMNAAEFQENGYVQYNTALEILKNIYAVGILAELSDKIKEYRIERNAFILSDSPVLINRIINQNDTPFIYEKMGNRFGHFLIDEFQDTSALQWHNFKPLISNALSQGNQNLLVGDAKQSIYRWRNSNWEILASWINNEYPAEILHFEQLRKNYRSGEKIVQFNSSLFPCAVQKLKKQMDNLITDSSILAGETQLLETIFGDVQQEVIVSNINKGNVFIRFFSQREIKEDENYYQELLINKINDLLHKGFLQSDIAILVRNKVDGQTIANLLVELNANNCFISDLNILSEESLFLDASNAVNLIIAAMQYLNDSTEAIFRAKLISSFEIHQQNLYGYSGKNGLNFNGQSLTIEKLQTTLPSDFHTKTGELLSLPLYDLAERLISIFKAQDAVSEIPFIHALLDLLNDYTSVNPGNLGKFLEFWEEEGTTKTVPAAESQNAIRVMTIHKAKGLEYRGVIIPFCSWKLDQKSNTILWAETEDHTYNYLPIVPLNYHKGLKNTEYASVYYSELFRSYVDNLNLMYVALTRSVESLIVFPVYNDSENSQGKINTVGDLMYESIVRGGDQFLSSGFNPLTNIYESRSEGNIIAATQKSDIIEKFFTRGNGTLAIEKISFRTRGLDYFENLQTSTPKGTVRGSVLHQILSTIETHNDLNSAMRQAVIEGLITGREGEELRDHILYCFQQGEVFAWFNGSGSVLTEKDIILPGGEIKRPDRVVLFPDRIHVIDYKFGGEENRDVHRRQVTDYVGHIQKMEHKPVEGFLWYIDQNEVIGV